jgi:prepilin-type processing-associated H-X9-DG protein
LFLNPDFKKGSYPEHYQNWNSALENEGLASSQSKTWWTEGVWFCPSASWSSRVLEHVKTPIYYGYNSYGILAVGDRSNALGLFGHLNPISGLTPIVESEVNVPSDMMAIADSFDASDEFMREHLVGLETYGNTLARHQGKANVLFCDGHVESPTLQFLFEDTSDAALVRWNRDHLPHREKIR